MNNKYSDCCACGSGCCGTGQEKKQIFIDFLYLDLSVCERCQGTEHNLAEAINQVSGVLQAAGFELVLNKINITSRELAIKHQFVSSPTIRVNGIDIALDVKESSCRECGDLCGDSVDCRVWIYEDVEYSEPPKAMIINAILRCIYSNEKADSIQKGDYKLPNNLKLFFEGLEGKEHLS
ncbi:MAG: DUF2703 domain-containing protein [Bacillota bacterium]